MELIKYNAACRAIAEAKAVDEVKDIRDKAEAMRQYARVSKNRQMEIDCAEIRIRAERRLGQMLQERKLNDGGRPSEKPLHSGEGFTPTLDEMGIGYNLSSRAQTIATIPEAEFERTMSEHREEQKAVTGRTMAKLTGKAEKKTVSDAVQSLMNAWRVASQTERHEFLIHIGLATDQPTTNVWDLYAGAYLGRYGVLPVRNATTNSKMRQLVSRIGIDAPYVAAFYVNHDNRYYVQCMHAVGALLHDAEKLRTEWATNTFITATKALQADRTQANGQVWGKMIAEAEANER